MCECYKIGGRFIAENPDCPAHCTMAQAEQREREALLQQIAELRAELEAMRNEAARRVRQ